MKKKLVITKDNLSEYRAIEIFMENVESFDIGVDYILDINIECDKHNYERNYFWSTKGYIKLHKDVNEFLSSDVSYFNDEEDFSIEDFKFKNRIPKYLDITSFTLFGINKRKYQVGIPYGVVESLFGGIIELSDCHSYEIDEEENIIIKFGTLSNMPKKENLFFEDIVDNWKNVLPEFKSSCAGFYTGKYYYKEIDGEITVSIVGNLEYKNGKDYDVRLVFENVSDYEEDFAEEITYIEIFKLASGEYFAQIGYVSEFKFERCYVEKIYL